MYFIDHKITTLRTACLIVVFIGLHIIVPAQQHYLKGEVKDESGNLLQNANILLHSSGYVYHTGTYGTFGILSNKNPDTLSIWMDGYSKEKVIATENNFVSVKLKTLPSANSVSRNKLASLTKGLTKEMQRQWFVGDETYASLLENHFINADRYPTTGLSMNIDRASYSNVRRFITTKTIVPPDAVRIEEMLNYFNTTYTEPPPLQSFSSSTMLTACPWNKENLLLYLTINSKKLDLEKLPPSNLVFLIDVSGSMDMPNRLPLLQSAFRMLVNNLRAKDTVTIVVYGGVTGIKLNATSGEEKEKILTAIDELTPGGSTPGESGIKIAYHMAELHFIKGGNNRVILATDGDFNVGVRSDEELEEIITQKKESGIHLTCLGVGMGNYKDSKIQMLARKGNGNFSYLDGYPEAEKVMMKEFTQTLFAVADDAYMNVDFNKNIVKQYRLIGFDNKVGALNDTTAIVEGGEIGSGNAMQVVFEIEPEKTISVANSTSIADVRLQYKLPGDTAKKQYSFTVPYKVTSFFDLDKSYRFSAAVIMFGSLLRNSPHAKSYNFTDIINLATSSLDEQSLIQKEFITILQQAKQLYSKKKRKRGDED